jgi:hypothetical protein
MSSYSNFWRFVLRLVFKFKNKSRDLNIHSCSKAKSMPLDEGEVGDVDSKAGEFRAFRAAFSV